MDLYENVDKLGEGGFGKVMLMKEKTTGDLYAVKLIELADYMQSADTINEIDRESKTLKMLNNNRHIIQLHNYFLLEKEIVLVMEYAKGGEVKQYL